MKLHASLNTSVLLHNMKIYKQIDKYRTFKCNSVRKKKIMQYRTEKGCRVESKGRCMQVRMWTSRPRPLRPPDSPLLAGCTETNAHGKVLVTLSAVAMQLLKHLSDASHLLDISWNIFNFNSYLLTWHKVLHVRQLTPSKPLELFTINVFRIYTHVLKFKLQSEHLRDF